MWENLYSILGVNKDATQEELKKAYRDKSKELHPDKPGGDKEKMQNIAKAYEILSNPDKRKLYDITGETDKDPIDMQVNDEVVNIFMLAISDPNSDIRHENILRKCKGIAYQNITKQRQNILIASRALKLLEEVLKRVSSKDGVPNVIGASVEAEIDSVKGQILVMEESLKLFDLVHKAFDLYSYTTDKPKSSDPADIVSYMIEHLRVNTDINFK